jgi:hypothetical protein
LYPILFKRFKRLKVIGRITPRPFVSIRETRVCLVLMESKFSLWHLQEFPNLQDSFPEFDLIHKILI